MNFYSQLGFKNKQEFTDDHQKCMVWSNEFYLMLMSFEKFKSYSQKPLPDFKNTIGSYVTLQVDSLERVNELLHRGLLTGGKESIPMLDEGFMQLRRIEDPDGHTWDVVFMDSSKF